jgi:hypothetical protein
MIKDYLSKLLRSKNTVFTFKDICLIWEETDKNLAKKRIYRYAKAGKLYPIRRGIYAKDKDYDRLELATRIFTPSYVSLETVLAREGVVFQHYDHIFVVSYLTREIICDGQTYVFRKMRNLILANVLGIEQKGNCAAATLERAFLDMLYLNKDYHFDNLAPLDPDKILELLPLYRNKAMAARLRSYRCRRCGHPFIEHSRMEVVRKSGVAPANPVHGCNARNCDCLDFEGS